MISVADYIRKIAREAPSKIEIECYDSGKLAKLLTYIKRTGNIGHSFDIVVDPDNKEHKMSFGWDGDGSDSISSIKVNGKKVNFEDHFEKDKSEKYMERFKKIR